MSFDMMKVSELRKVADSFGIECGPKVSKKDVIAMLEEEGVSYQMYEKFSGAEKKETQRQEPRVTEKPKLTKENTVLVKMDRANPSFSIGRFTFTQDHPFIAMSERDAQYIFDTITGFRPATPREVENFYN